MPRGSNQKFKLYRLAQIMMEQTDDEHYITMPEIIEELAKYDVTADRKSVYADLRDLSILGIEVEGEPIGKITDVFPTGSNDVFEVLLPGGKKAYIPNIHDVVKKIDIDNKDVTIHVMEGLIDDED